jgi:hypothetical protein
MRVRSRLAVVAFALGAVAACGDRGTSTVAAAPQAAPPARVAASTTAASPAPVLARDLQEIVDRFRKIVVLVEDQSALDTAARGQADTVGRLLFQENHQALAALTGRLLASPAAVGTFLDDLERNAELHDADKLAFRDVVDDLLVSAREGKPGGASALAGLRGRLTTPPCGRSRSSTKRSWRRSSVASRRGGWPYDARPGKATSLSSRRD